MLRHETFKQTQASVPIKHALVFLRQDKFLPGLDCEHADQPMACCVSKTCTVSDKHEISSQDHSSWSDH